MNEILRLDKITKEFPGVLALDAVDFDLRAGEVHALCGENGAGKSTLMKVITGIYFPEEGTVTYKGKRCNFSNITDAQEAGIAIIHQELMLVPRLTVAENIFLGREPRAGIFINSSKMIKDAEALLKRLDTNISPRVLVKELSVAQQQMVEVAKALSFNAEVLIMDEPTSALTESEIDRLFEIIHQLRNEGVGIIYISHRLEELKHIVDRVTIFRDGKYVCTYNFRDITLDDIVNNMVGRSLEEKFPQRLSLPVEEIIFEVKDLSRKGFFKDVNFDLRRGEILGFAGLMGAGRSEVARVIFGADAKDSGDILLFGRKLSIKSPQDAIKEGVAYLSEDRKLNGLALSMSVMQNITMANMEEVVDGKLKFISRKKEINAAEYYVEALEIKTPSIEQIVKNLSGGNQQKVVISKWLFRHSKILFFDEPTRGIDVGAKFAIYTLLDKLASQGIGVIMISSELPEILGLTDRVAVFHEGCLAGVLETSKTGQEEIMEYASGIKKMQL